MKTPVAKIKVQSSFELDAARARWVSSIFKLISKCLLMKAEEL